MNTLLVTSTHESTGKTAVTLALGLLARERGQSVGYMKPKGTRLQSNVGKTLDQDPMLAREILDLDAEGPLLTCGRPKGCYPTIPVIAMALDCRSHGSRIATSTVDPGEARP